nr:8694_t:CDS:2 [Entrophospora candida]
MSFHVYQILELGPLQPNEQVFENFTDSRTGAPSTTEDLNTIHQTSSNEITAQHPTHPTPSGEIVPHPIISWEPSQKFMQVKEKFESYILHQYPCVPCSFCSRLLYPEKAKWTQKIENFEYPLIQANLNLRPKSTRKSYSSAYSEYWSIVGTFGYSKNIRSLTLYSGMIGAFLEEYNPNSQDHCWFDRSLIAGANWLADNNPYLREYKNALVTNSSGSVSSFPNATHLPDDETAPEFQKHGELYFYQKLLLRVPARSEGDLIGTYETYHDHYLARFPEEFGNSIKSDQQNQHHQTINMLDQYTNLIENLLYSLQSLLTQDIKGIIRSQLENTKILPPIVPNNMDQQAIPDKSIHKKFSELNKNFLLMAPTGVAAVNIQGQTIHSALRIWSHGGRYQTLAFADQEFNQEL